MANEKHENELLIIKIDALAKLKINNIKEIDLKYDQGKINELENIKLMQNERIIFYLGSIAEILKTKI